MTKQELRKLNRSELLELLLDQASLNEELQAQLDEAKEEAETQEAAVDMASVIEAIQQINENIAKVEIKVERFARVAPKDSGESAQQSLQEIKKQMAEMVARAEVEAEQRIEAATIRAEQIIAEAQNDADRMREEAYEYSQQTLKMIKGVYQDYMRVMDLYKKASLNQRKNGQDMQ